MHPQGVKIPQRPCFSRLASTTVSPPGNREPEPDLSYQLIAQFVTWRPFELSIDRTKIPLGGGRELGESKEF